MDWKIAKSLTHELLSSAGVTVNGKNPWDIQVHNEEFYARVIHQGALGIGESYMDKQWDCVALDQFFERIISCNLEQQLKSNKRLLFKYLLSRIFNRQTQKRAFDVGTTHYDLGNDLFQNMLDSRMIYTCGFWQNAQNLEQAQLHKLNLTCQKLLLKPGMRILDIGCGWGGLAKYAAENFGVEVVGVTVSKKQQAYAQQLCQHLPIDIRLQDYRDINEKFDRVVSLGMFEHVGHLNYRTYMQTVQQCLKEDGLFLLHTIGNNTTIYAANAWITKYIFPNGAIPSISQISKSIEGLFVMEDWHNFGADYDKTLMAWCANFKKNWNQLKHQYNERFFRMWSYYLLSCAGAFRARDMQLWQVVLTKKGVKGGYPVTRPYFLTESASRNSAKSLHSVPRSLARFESLV